ncbi:MAG: Phosphoglycerate dehydrogenase [Clostridiales bacterium]|jgi:D-3-phosphoglycerate dehydrogenase|nr:Phosphoglycerate dehydrogenase [Clostridiales bacterium]
MAKKVLIPQDITAPGKNYLIEKGYEIKMGTGITVDAIAKDVEDCDAILARTAQYPAEVFKAGKKLKVIARHGVGVDNFDVDAATELGIYVCYAPLSNGLSVAEHTITLILALAKNLVKVDKEFRNGDFEIRNRLKGMDVEGKTLGLVGLGRIGTMVAKKAALGLGMKVIGYDPFITKDKVSPEIELVGWDEVFKNSDLVSLHLPATKETKGSVSAKEFEMMKDSAFLINCARGEIVDEAELIKALQEKKIAGAGLDVFQEEPTPKDNPLLKMENVIVTPHYATSTVEAMDRMGLHAAIGIDEVLSGKEPSWVVNKPKK